MCGIVGIVVDASVETARAVAGAMAERIHHRGPDGGGVIAHPDATLAMKRLAIVDVPDGHQPMANDDESVVIVYNGEVYNAPQLRAELIARGVRFRTRSDTEVILRLYEADPDRVEKHLVGMWAFAIHDRRRRRLVLSRDRFGIKPLFIARAGRTVAFASELSCFDRTFAPISSCFEIDHRPQRTPDETLNLRPARIGVPGLRPGLSLRGGRRQHDVLGRDPPAGLVVFHPRGQVSGNRCGAEHDRAALFP